MMMPSPISPRSPHLTGSRATISAAVGAITRYTVLEAIRGRVPLVMLAWVLLAFALGAFLRQIAMIEGAEIQLAIIAALARVGAVFILMSFTISSIVRESADKGVELVLAHPLPRWQYIIGRFAGFALVAVMIALAMALPLVVSAALDRLLAWVASLALELILVAAAAMFFTLTLSHHVAAFAAVGSFYVLARAIDALVIIARTGEHTTVWSDRMADGIVHALASVLPHLDRFTAAAWLTDGVPAGALGVVLAQTAIYVAVLLSATLVDFYRQNF